MRPEAANPVKLFMGILYSDVDQLNRAREILLERFGEIDFKGEPFPFSVTDYYVPEMGSPIYRIFISHEPLVQPEQIIEIKLETNMIEEQAAVGGKRKVNLDPGYMDTCKVVLASAKFNGQKIYIGKGIYADLTLYYEKGSFRPYPWSFPDFKSGQYTRPFLRIRELYKTQLKDLRSGACPGACLGARPSRPQITLTSATSESPNKGWHSRGYLPHFDADAIIQFITFRLYDSVPSNLIDQWKKELNWSERTPQDSQEAITLRKRLEAYEDSGKGCCYLCDQGIAALVQKAFKHFDGERYGLIAWCIMPNHVHVLIETNPCFTLPDIVQSWKSFTAHEANKLLGRTGPFWMPDYFDRFIRDNKHFAATIEYIRQNPVKAGLVDVPERWPWLGISPGSVLPGNAAVSDANS